MPSASNDPALSTASQTGTGAAWFNPSGVVAAGGTQSQCSPSVPGQTSNVLTLATGAINGLPADATVTGFTVSVTREDGGGPGTVVDSLVAFELTGGAQSSNLALAGAWPTTLAPQGYGGGTDLCGITSGNAVPANVRPGVTVSLACSFPGGLNSAYVDLISFTVYYTGGTTGGGGGAAAAAMMLAHL